MNTIDDDNPLQPESSEPKETPKVKPKPTLAVRRSRWADAGTRDYVRPVPGFTREFGRR